ncbi:MAG: type II toxin-antitoxin system VapC family toxin [SAR324 cluster bacterium]|nr:type II toxin-antitoxin system VapC family toxin [SAR324 cluster bacterium]
MEIVSDTNLFLAVVLDEPEKERIIELTMGHRLISPEILPFEIGNALTAMMKRNRLSSNEVISAWEVVKTIPVNLKKVNIRSALEIANQFKIYAYDAYFIECAISMRCPLLTLDQRMMNVAKECGIRIFDEY